MEIANFEYKEKEYVFILENNQIKYGYKENGELHTDFTKEEDDMMKYVMSKIFISSDKKNHHKCGKFIHDRKMFQIMYDEISEKKFFYEIVDNEYKFPTLNDNIYLYKIFNLCVQYLEKNIDTEVIKKHEPNERKKKIKQYVQFFGTHITVFILSTVITAAFTMSKNNKIINNPTEYNMVNESYEEELTIDDLENNLQKNTNLTDEEKDEFRKFYKMVEENKEYISSDLIIDIFENVNINYVPKEKSGIKGEHDLVTHDIYLYETNSYEDVKEDEYTRTTLYHEIGHEFQKTGINLGHALLEAVNEQISMEYTNSIPESYYNERMYFYALCELVNLDCFKELKFKCNIKPLINELKKIIDDEELAYELLGNIDCQRNLLYEVYECKTIDEEEEIRKQINDVKEKIYYTISEYFSAKYSYPIEEDEIMMSFLCNPLTFPLENLSNLNDMHLFHDPRNIFKGYFSKDFKKAFPYVIVNFTTESMKHMQQETNINNPYEYYKYIEDKDREQYLLERTDIENSIAKLK